MSTQIDKIDLNINEYIFIYYKGSCEISLCLKGINEGIEISGPLNCNTKTYLLPANGKSIVKRR